MDRDRFDALARLLATSGSRRVTLGALLGVVLGPAAAEAAKKRRQDRGKDKDGDRDRSGNRGRDQALQAERRGKGGKRRKTKMKRRGGSGGGPTEPPPPDGCCGTKQCAGPEPGSTSAGCDFAGRAFTGQDHNGSLFRRIDGRAAVFTATDNHGSIFAEACLQGARFRRAKLDGSTWGGACLFDADFTGADLGGDETLFDNALFCGTVMPDGSVNNRDCGRATACCRAELGGGDPPCQTAADCADEACRTKTCTNGQCAYAVVADGPDPTDECGAGSSGHCCEGECCATGATECNPDGLCCVPNCAGRNCGDDGCGGSCGTCPSGVDCDQTSGRCACGAANCPNGCCASDGSCQPGNSDSSCGTGGEACAQCTAQEECAGGACAPIACTGVCGETGDCPDVPNCICNLEAGGVCCRPNCAGKVCGSDGCGGSCGPCAIGQQCSTDGTACICTSTSCGPPINGCCIGNSCEPGNTADACGSGGFACEICPESWICISPTGGSAFCECTPDCTDRTCGPNGCGGNCGFCDPTDGQRCTDQGLCICDAVSCPSGCCDFNGLGPCVPGSTSQFCGAGGAVCVSCAASEVCCGGSCQTEPIVWANVTTFGSEGDGPGQLAGPFGVAVSADGQTAWVSDTANNRVSIWTRTGSTWTNLTSFGSGPGSDEDEFHDPMGLAVSADEQTVWVTDNGNNRVSVWTKTGPTTWANLTTFGELDFNDPFDVAVSADEQTVWVADARNNLISIWTRTGPTTWTNLHNFGVGGDGRDELDFPIGVAVSSLLGEGVILVADSGNNRIAVWEGSGTNWGQVAAFGSVGSGPGQLNAPGGVAVAANTGTVPVADTDNNRVSVWVTPDFATWTVQSTFGSQGAGPSQLLGPIGVAASPDGQTVWVADSGNSRISVWALTCASG